MDPELLPRAGRGAPRAPRAGLRPQAPGRRSVRSWDDDGELVRAILAGSREHFETLYAAYFPRVYRFALKRLGDPGEAEDVTQEVFFTVFQALPSFAGDSTLLVWIFGITRNKVNRRFRRPRMPRLWFLPAECADHRTDRGAGDGSDVGAGELHEREATGRVDPWPRNHHE